MGADFSVPPFRADGRNAPEQGMEDITHFLLPISHQPIPDGVCRLLETGVHFRELQHWSIYLPLPKHPGEQVTQWVDDALRGCGSSVHASLSRTVGWQLERAWWGDTAPEQRDRSNEQERDTSRMTQWVGGRAKGKESRFCSKIGVLLKQHSRIRNF